MAGERGGTEVDDVEVIDAALAANLFGSDALPDLAAWLVASGRESGPLVELAGLDLEPFDPRDAAEPWATSVQELRGERIAAVDGADLVARVVATAWVSGVVDDARGFELLARIGRVALRLSEPERDRLELTGCLLSVCGIFVDRSDAPGNVPTYLARSFAEAKAIAQRSPRFSPGIVELAVRSVGRG